jgi:hypothetical protein
MNRIWWLLISGVLAAGCSSGDSGQEPQEVAAPQAPTETVFDPLVGTMDRAKSVDTLSADRMEELNNQLEESE